MTKGTIQSLLALNSFQIQNLEHIQKVLRDTRKNCFKHANPEDPDTHQAYLDGKAISNRLIAVDRTLAKHRSIAVELKKFIATNYPRTAKPKKMDRRVANFMDKVRQ